MATADNNFLKPFIWMFSVTKYFTRRLTIVVFWSVRHILIVGLCDLGKTSDVPFGLSSPRPTAHAIPDPRRREP